jgi:hypothetical protein
VDDIVGVVRDTRHVGPLRDAMPQIHVPYMQFRSTRIQPRALIVRTVLTRSGFCPSCSARLLPWTKINPWYRSDPWKQNLSDFIARSGLIQRS